MPPLPFGLRRSVCLLVVSACLAHLQIAFAQDKRVPIPASTDREAARKEITSIIPFDAATREQRVALAKTLLDTGLDTPDDLVSRFELFNLSREQSELAGDVQSAFAAIDQIEKTYQLDADSVRVTTLRNLGKAKGVRKIDREKIRDAGNALIERLNANSQYPRAVAVSRVMVTTATQLRDPAMAKEMGLVVDRCERIATAYAGVPGALAKIEKNGNDAASNLIVGRFYIFHRANWKSGFQYLSKCNDAKLSKIADLENAVPTDAANQLKIADMWFAMGDTSDKLPEEQSVMYQRAAGWYQRAASRLGGLSKQKAKVRLASLADRGLEPIDLALVDSDKIADVTSVPVQGASGLPETIEFPIVADGIYDARWSRAKSIELFDYVSLPRDQIHGTWSKDDKSLTVISSSDFTRVRLPIIPPEEFDLEFEVESRSTADIINITFPIPGGNRIGLQFGSTKGKKLGGLEMLRRKGFHDNATTIKHPFLNVGKRTKVQISVRRNSVSTIFDGRPAMRYDGDLSVFDSYRKWESPNRLSIVLGCHANNHLVFRSAKLAPVRKGPLPAASPQHWRSPVELGVPHALLKRDEVFLDEFPLASFRVGYGTVGLRGATGRTESVKGMCANVQRNGVVIPHAITMHSWRDGHSTAVFNLEGKFTGFKSHVGALQAIEVHQKSRTLSTRGTMYFRVYGDGRLLGQTNGLRIRGGTVPLQADVTGIKTLTLSVECRGDASGGWTAWFNPVLSR